MKKILSYIISIAAIGLIFSACTSECYVQQRALVNISFIDSLTFKEKDINGLTVCGLLNDSILYNNAKVKSIDLPLHFNETRSVFKLILPNQADNTIKDTILLNIDHTPKPQLVSQECGCVMFHTLNDVSLHKNTYNFSISINDPNVVNDGQRANIKIFH